MKRRPVRRRPPKRRLRQQDAPAGEAAETAAPVEDEAAAKAKEEAAAKAKAEAAAKAKAAAEAKAAIEAAKPPWEKLPVAPVAEDGPTTRW